MTPNNALPACAIPHLDLRLLNFSRIAAAVAIILVIIFAGVSQASLAQERKERAQFASKVNTLEAELIEMKRHCAMDRKAMQKEIDLLKLRR